jgi:two-component system sensor histidine kinase YesM
VENRASEFASVILQKAAFIWETKITEIVDYFIAQFYAYKVCQNLKNVEKANQPVIKLRVEKALADIITYKENIKFILIDDRHSWQYFQKRENEYYFPSEIAELIPYDHVRSLRAKPYFFTGPDRTIILSKVLYDLETSEYLGFLTVGFDYSFFSNVFPDESKAALGLLMIVDNLIDKPVIVSSGAEHLVSSYLSKDSTSSDGSDNHRRIHGTRYILEEIKTNDDRWLLQSYIALSDMTRLSASTGLYILLATGFALAVATVLSAFLTNRETERILKIKDHAQRIASGDLTVVSRESHMDELGQLSGSLENLSDRISDLVESLASEKARLDEVRYRALQSEYSALQSKINPHFLYNSLEMVNAMAKLKADKEISEMIQLIGELMRESIRRKNSLITLKEELGYIGKYLEIQEILHDNSLDTSIDVPTELESRHVPNFILQPIVENAIVHGIEPQRAPGKIAIKARCKDDTLTIDVLDNGIGMSEDKIRSVMTREEEEDLHHVKIGLASVDRRIRIMYGEAYGLRIVSNPGEGTCVSLCLPAVTQDGA